jgi:hypothetical protein
MLLSPSVRGKEQDDGGCAEGYGEESEWVHGFGVLSILNTMQGNGHTYRMRFFWS